MLVNGLIGLNSSYSENVFFFTRHDAAGSWGDFFLVLLSSESTLYLVFLSKFC